MYVGSTDYGQRAAIDVTHAPVRWFSTGISQAGDITTISFGRKEHDIKINWVGMSETLKTSLETYLNDTILPWGVVSVTPDTGDDLEIGASGAVNLNYVGNSFSAKWRAYALWDVSVTFRLYTS